MKAVSYTHLDVYKRQIERGITIVFVTHNAETADYCHRVIFVRDGLVERDHSHVPKAGIYRGEPIEPGMAPAAPVVVAANGRAAEKEPARI